MIMIIIQIYDIYKIHNRKIYKMYNRKRRGERKREKRERERERCCMPQTRRSAFLALDVHGFTRALTEIFNLILIHTIFCIIAFYLYTDITSCHVI